MAKTASSSLSKFAVNKPTDPTGTTGTTGTTDKGIVVTRGKNKRVGIAVRLSHDDWHRATDFAMREQTSLQRLIVAGISELLKQRGLPPLTGE